MAPSLVLIINSKCNSRKTGNFHNKGQVVLTRPTNPVGVGQIAKESSIFIFSIPNCSCWACVTTRDELEKLFSILAGPFLLCFLAFSNTLCRNQLSMECDTSLMEKMPSTNLPGWLSWSAR